jgi:putative transposase
MRVAFVDSEQEEHGVQPVLQALEDTPAQIAPSTYYATKTRPASARSRRDEELTALIKQIHAANYGVYGARKIWHELHRWAAWTAARQVAAHDSARGRDRPAS